MDCCGLLKPSAPPLPPLSLVVGGSKLLAVLVGRILALAGVWVLEGGLTEHISDEPFLNSFRARCKAEHPPSFVAEYFSELDGTVSEAEGASSPFTSLVGRK